MGWMETKLDEKKQSEVKGNKVEQKEMMYDERKWYGTKGKR